LDNKPAAVVADKTGIPLADIVLHIPVCWSDN